MSFLDNIKAIPITDFAERLGFTLVRKGNKYVSLKEHDSVMIDTYKNCFWRNSTFNTGRKGGAGSVIDFAIEFNDAADYKAAMRQLAVMYGIEGESNPKVEYTKPAAKKEVSFNQTSSTELAFPEKASSNEDVFNYLFKERHISRDVLRYFFAKKMLYQDQHNNCVFATPNFCCVRSTGEKRFVQDKPGCDYNECFYFKGKNNNDTLIVAESVIDIMSFMTELCDNNVRFVNYDYLALSGTNKLMSVKYHVQKNPAYKEVVLCYDNDEAGKSAIAATTESLAGMDIEILEYQAPKGNKDWNEYICKKNEK